MEERTQRCEQLQADLSYCKAQLASAEQQAAALSQQERCADAWALGAAGRWGLGGPAASKTALYTALRR